MKLTLHRPDTRPTGPFAAWRTFLPTTLVGAVLAGLLPPEAAAGAGETSRPSVTTSLALDLEGWSNTGGGKRPGSWWLGVAELACAIGSDTQGCVFAQARGVVNGRTGQSFGDMTGAWNPASGSMAGDQIRVHGLGYRRRWEASGIELKIGLLAADDDFMVSEPAGQFLNSAFGAMPSQVSTTLASQEDCLPAYPVYPLASPGLWFRVPLGRLVRWQSGTYLGSPGRDLPSNHGFDWRGHGAFLSFNELSWADPDRPAAGCTTVGLVAHDGRFDDCASARGGGPARSARGLASAYVMHDRVLVEGGPDRARWSSFVRYGATLHPERDAVAWYADAGVVCQGPFRHRSEDTAGIAISRTRFADDFAGLNGVARRELVLELTYTFRATARLRIQVDAQQSVDAAPGNAGPGRAPARIVGLRTSLEL